MCGILAITSTKLTLTEPLIKKMLSSISHRGRDYQGFVHISQHNVWIGHARHSIIDLSPRAHQPMTNEDNTLFLSFNGEIYNFKSLKEELIKHGHIFKSSTDAEVIIHGYEQWGVAVLQKLNGMFSFILYNSEKNEFFCARDRIGIKPFYYSVLPDTFMIASEIKPFLQLYSYNVNYTSLCEYLTYRYVPSPNTIYNNIFKLPPAHYLIFNHRQIQIEPYWDVPINDSNCHNDLTNHIENLIIQSVQAHLISDVPVGIFLSGGIDSSTIALMTKKLGYKPTAFTIGFNNWALSEDKPATQTAKALGIDIKTKLLDPESLQNVYESAYFYDEPIADISIVPTFEISRWASQYVRTVLSGDGGDELFAGYTWHQKLINNRYIIRWKKNGIVNFYAQSMAMGLFHHKELKFLIHASKHSYIPDDPFHFYKKHYIKDIHPLKAIQYLDLKTFLAELILTKVDRASMAHTLEVRVPFLNHTLVEFMFSLSPKAYFSKKQSKILLRKILFPYLPEQIINAPKQGFVGPNSFYHQTSYYKSMLSNSLLIENQIISKSAVEKYFQTNDYWKLWKILVLEIWARKWLS